MTTESKPPFNPPFYYGWIIIIVSFVTLFFSGPGQTYSVSVFIDSYINDFGWSRSLVSSMYSLGTLAAGLTMGFMGSLFDKHGHRKMTTIVSLVFGFACLWMSFIFNLPMLLIGFFLIRLLGQGSMSLSSTTLVPQWFIKKKGTALSFVILGGTMSMIILPVLNTWFIQNLGWRTGWQIWAVLLWIVMAPIAYIFTRNTPESIGLLPDNEVILPEDIIDNQDLVDNSWTLREALMTKAFWIILYTMVVASAINTGLIFHQFSILGQVGLNVTTIAMITSLISLVRVPINFIIGPLSDRVQLKYMMFASMGLLCVSVMTIYLADSIQLVIVYGLFMALQMGVERIVTSVIWPEYFGRRYLSSIRGIAMMSGVIGSALGPLPYGFAFDIFGGYKEALIISFIFPLIGAILGLMAGKPMKS